MLQLGAVVIAPEHEPPRPALVPRSWLGAAWINRFAGMQVAAGGLAVARVVQFASSEHQGFVTHAQTLALIALYEAGAPFTLTTDLLHPLGTTAVAYTAMFDPAGPPSFAPRMPDSTLYSFDIALVVSGDL